MGLSVIGSELQQQELARRLVQHKYVGFAKGKVIQFSKGIKSPGVYGDCRKVLSNSVLRNYVLKLYCNFLHNYNEVYSGIAAVETGGIGFGVLLAEAFGESYLGVRKAPKGHGDQSWFAGDIELFRDLSVLVVEDITTTAGSLLSAVTPLREQLNCNVTTALTVFSYGFPEMITETDAAKIEVYTLCTFKQMLEAARRERIIDTEYESVIRHWLGDPHDESWITDEWTL